MCLLLQDAADTGLPGGGKEEVAQCSWVVCSDKTIDSPADKYWYCVGNTYLTFRMKC